MLFDADSIVQGKSVCTQSPTICKFSNSLVQSASVGRACSLCESAEIVEAINVDGNISIISTSPKNFFNSVFNNDSASALFDFIELALIVMP